MVLSENGPSPHKIVILNDILDRFWEDDECYVTGIVVRKGNHGW